MMYSTEAHPLQCFTQHNILRLTKSISISLFYAIILCGAYVQPVCAKQENLVRSIFVRGNQSFSQKQLLDLMQTKSGKPYDIEKLKEDTEKIKRFLHDKGYIYAKVSVQPIKIQNEDGVFIRIEIYEGIIGDITLTGNTKTKDSIILRDLLFQEGDVFVEADRKESERIISKKPFIGAAKIETELDEETNKVNIHVSVTEFFSITGAFDPGFNSQSGYFLTQVKESNLFGSGQGGEISYERITELEEKPRGLITLRYRLPRLINTHWNFNGEYVQKREGDSWGVELDRPQYSLKSKWSAKLGISEQINLIRWYEDGKRTDIFEQTLHRSSGNILRYYGDRHHQNHIGLWIDSYNTRFVPIERSFESEAALLNRNIRRIGVIFGRKNVGFYQTRFLKRMGREEYFITGSIYNASFGYSSPIFGSDRMESYAALSFDSGWVSRDKFFGTAYIGYITSFTNRIERSLLESRWEMYLMDVFNTGDIYRVDTGFRKNGLFDLQQIFVAKYRTQMQFGWSGQSQVILGSGNGLRGYGVRQFSGEKMMLLSLESRTLCGGDFFKRLNDGLTKAATFVSRPFVRDQTIDLGLVLSLTLFADFGYVWDRYSSFHYKNVKRSIGFGLRGSFARVDAGIFRFELAYPLDPPFTPSFQPQLFYGLEREF